MLGSEMLHNWQVPVQNDNAGLPVHNLWDLVQNGSVFKILNVNCGVFFFCCAFLYHAILLLNANIIWLWNH